MKAKLSVLLLATLTLASCAMPPPRPLVDLKGVDSAKYETDLRECQAYAEQTYGTGSGAAVGAGAGFALGYILCRTLGGRDCSSTGRAVGVTGAASGAVAGAREQREVVQRCLSGRGYRVLN